MSDAQLTLVVPSSHAGFIIGKAGATLKRITQTSGVAKIQLSQPCANESVVDAVFAKAEADGKVPKKSH